MAVLLNSWIFSIYCLATTASCGSATIISIKTQKPICPSTPLKLPLQLLNPPYSLIPYSVRAHTSRPTNSATQSWSPKQDSTHSSEYPNKWPPFDYWYWGARSWCRISSWAVCRGSRRGLGCRFGTGRRSIKCLQGHWGYLSSGRCRWKQERFIGSKIRRFWRNLRIHGGYGFCWRCFALEKGVYLLRN